MDDFLKKLTSPEIILVSVGILLLVIGIFVFGLSVGQTVVLALVLGGGVVALRTEKGRALLGSIRGRSEDDSDKRTREDVYHHPPEDSMKTLMFDDYQSSGGGKYIVKEVTGEEPVIPSTKSVNPAPARVREEKVKQFTVSDFVDLESDLAEVEPRSEFHTLLKKTLIALRDVLFAHSVLFHWVNREKRQLVLEASATDSQNLVAEKRLPIESDIASRVAQQGKPLFVGRVTPVSEKELIRHYNSAEYVKSVVAVPVFYPGEPEPQMPVGVIMADSKAEDAFGPETLEMLGHFTKLVSSLIKSYTGKYDLLLDSELLTSLRRLQDRVKSDPGEYMVLSSLSEEANRLVNWDCLTITMYAEEKQGWIIQKVVNKSGTPYVAPDQMIDFGTSLVGKSIKENHVEVVDDLSAGGSVRFYTGEVVGSEGSIVCIPISSFNRCYGALTLESRNKKNFSGKEAETMYRLVECAASLLEVVYMNDLVKEYVIVDQVTGSFNQRHFLKKLDQEVVRAGDFGTELALVTVVVDDRHDLCGRHGKEGFETILNQIARIIRAATRPYDIIGRLEDDRIAVLLVNTTASDAYLWAEKMRKQVASSVIVSEGRSFSVTMSAGVCGLIDGMHKEELLQGTSQVLHKAVEGGGNLVRVF